MGAVPRPAVGVGQRIGHRRQCPVRGSPVGGGGGPVRGRTYQGMPEAHVRAELKQAGRVGQVHGSCVQAECPSRPQEKRRIPDRIGRREQDQPLDLGPQLTQARRVPIFDTPGQVSRVRQAETAGEVGGAAAPVQLEQRQRMAVCFLENPGADALVERTGDDRRQQRPSRLVIESAEQEFGQARQVIRRGSC